MFTPRDHHLRIGPRRVNGLQAIPEHSPNRWRNGIPPAAQAPAPEFPAPRPAIKTSPPGTTPQQGYADWFGRAPELASAPTQTGFRYTLRDDHLPGEEDSVPLQLEFYPANLIGARRREKYLVKNREYTIGRRSDCDIYIDCLDTVPELIGINGVHAKLKVISFRESIY
jgi:hypothetical protein